MKFKISKPVRDMMINQGFGVNGEYYRKNGINIKGHNGIDIITPHGEPIYAAHDGLALYQVDSHQGHGVVIITKESYEFEDRETPFKTIYWHLCSASMDGGKYQSPIADKGAVEVKKGDLIGYADSTGFSTGDHLHFAVKPLAKKGENLYTWGPLDPDNGYNGCVDPMPYFDYIEDRNKVVSESLKVVEETVKVIAKSDASASQKWQWLEGIKNFLKSLKF